jgi:uncharacterized protein
MKPWAAVRAAFFAIAAAVSIGAQGATPLADTEVRELRSKEMGRRYQIYTALSGKPAPEQGYAVVYCLDANIMFGTMVDVVRSIERRPNVSATLVIGVGYPADLQPATERAIDLTPSLTADPPAGSGGAEEFMRFIERELKPDVAARFKIDRSRETLFGHSYGGLFTLYTLINDPAAFDTFIVASPSIWFENRLLQKANVRERLSAKLQATQATPRVLLTVGEYEQAADPDFPPVPGRGSTVATLQQRAQVDSAHEFAEFLGKLDGIESRLAVFPDEDHGTVIAAAISRGVRFALAPNAKPPAPAPREVEAGSPPAGIAVPSAEDYLKLEPDARYQLRMRIRALPDAQRKAWNDRFQHSLSAGLTYAQHRRLHEERVAMDAKHGTAPPPED